jgi:site-specific recombinase XerD
MVLLLLDTGIRASELCTLTLENTFVKEGYIKVSGKGDKERMVAFGATTKKALMRYLTTFRPQSDDPYLVLTSQGVITYTALNHCIKRIGISVGIPRLHPHLFRHTFAVNYLMNGGDIMSLRLMLGHTDISVTQMYLHLAESHVQIQHAKFSPVDRLLLGGRKKTAS